MSIESNIEEIIKAEYCDNCMKGLHVQDIGVYCMANDENDLPKDWELPGLSRPMDSTCNCEKYEFDEDVNYPTLKHWGLRFYGLVS